MSGRLPHGERAGAEYPLLHGSRPKGPSWEKRGFTVGKIWLGHFWYTNVWVPDPPPPPQDPSARGHTGTAASPSHQRLGGVRGSSAVWTAVRLDNQRGVPSLAGEVRAHWPWVTTFGGDPTQPNPPPSSNPIEPGQPMRPAEVGSRDEHQFAGHSTDAPRVGKKDTR